MGSRHNLLDRAAERPDEPARVARAVRFRETEPALSFELGRSPTHLSPVDALSLQRTVGNAAVSALLAGREDRGAIAVQRATQSPAGSYEEPLKVQRSFLSFLRRIGRGMKSLFGDKKKDDQNSAPAPTEYQNVDTEGKLIEQLPASASSLASALEGPGGSGALKAQGPYSKLLKRGAQYENEASAGMVELPGIVAGAKKALVTHKELLEKKGIRNLSDFMVKQYGWTAQDVKEYLPGDNLVPGKAKVKYLGAGERQDFELLGGSPFHQGRQKGPFTTEGMYSKHSGDDYGIFVMDQGGRLYADRHKVGLFHHSSFLAGGDVACGGELKVSKSGQLQHLTSKTGHYRAGLSELFQAVEEVRRRGIGLGTFTVSSFDNTINGLSAQAFHDQMNPGRTPAPAPAPEKIEYNTPDYRVSPSGPDANRPVGAPPESHVAERPESVEYERYRVSPSGPYANRPVGAPGNAPAQPSESPYYRITQGPDGAPETESHKSTGPSPTEQLKDLVPEEV